MADAQRSDWTIDEVRELFELPLLDLVRRSGRVHGEFHDADEVHVNQLLSIRPARAPRTAGTARSRCITTPA